MSWPDDTKKKFDELKENYKVLASLVGHGSIKDDKDKVTIKGEGILGLHEQASDKLDETWEDIDKIKELFTREQYLKIFSKFSKEITKTDKIARHIIVGYRQITEIRVGVKEIQNSNLDSEELKQLDNEVERMNSILDGETKHNQLIKSRIQGILDYLKTIQEQLSDERMEKTTVSQHEISLDTHKLAKTQVKIAILIGLIAGSSLVAAIWFGYGTSVVLDNIKFLEQERNRIENFPPIFEIDGGYINFLGNGLPRYEFNNGITLTAVTSHYLKFSVTNVTLSYLNQNHAPCYFNEGPEFNLGRTSPVVLSPDGESKQIEPEIYIDFKAFGNFHSTRYLKDEGVFHDLGSIIFDIHVEDIQDKTKVYDLQTYTSLVVRIPPNLSDAIRNCEILASNS